jgi:hypothetical protein
VWQAKTVRRPALALSEPFARAEKFGLTDLLRPDFEILGGFVIICAWERSDTSKSCCQRRRWFARSREYETSTIPAKQGGQVNHSTQRVTRASSDSD